MKAIVQIAAAAALAAGVVAQPHNHGHQHFHAKKHAQPGHSHAEKRDGSTVVVTEVVPAVVYDYVLDGKHIDSKKAEQGIEEGLFLVMGKTEPSFTAPPPVYSTIVPEAKKGAQFFEKVTSTSKPAPKPTPTPKPKPPPKEEKPKEEKPKEDPKPDLTGDPVDRVFPNKKVKCNKFPSDYGAVQIPWSTTEGWATIMKVGKLIPGVKLNNIEVAVKGGCFGGAVCSYACPPGYQKTQWPNDNQGLTGQSVGGLYCNDEGFLELTRPQHTKLCEPGAGGVFIRNELPGTAAVCRTDYPGSEEMNIPIDTRPGSTYPLTNPKSSEYYVWEGMPTTAQYYVNPLDVPVDDACTWNSKSRPDAAGNWAPTCIGVGKDDSGITYLSVFPNAPTSIALLDFDIEIEGDVSGECWLRNGQYSQNNGCTVGIKDGGQATVVFKKRSS